MRGKEFIFNGTNFVHHSLSSKPSEEMLAAMSSGDLLYDYPTLKRYATEDAALINQVNPDLVVSDMRWFAPFNARLAGIPCMLIQNSCWSPKANPRIIPLPEFMIDYFMVRIFGEHLTERIGLKMLPLIMRKHIAPLNRLLDEYGFPKFHDFFAALTTADYVLYADTPQLVPIQDLPTNHHYLGPILWQPDLPPPKWWDKIPTDRPIVYVALGSSGHNELLPAILSVLAVRPVTVLAAAPAHFSSDRVFASPFFPYDEAARRAAIVIGNGGTGIVYQAVKAGVPGLGIVTNIDQLMTMARVERQGCGIMLRSSRANETTVAACVDKLLGNSSYKQAALRLQKSAQEMDSGKMFVEIVERIMTNHSNSLS